MTGVPDSAIARLRDLARAPGLPERYTLHEPIGAGGMGLVWRATDGVLGREVAVKLLAPHASGAEFAERLAREAEVLARLEHPGVVPVHDAGRLADGSAFYVMKLVRGRRLDEHAAGLAPGELLRLFIRVCETVAFAHEAGVLHRDLKPANIMVGGFGEVLVLDWGVAKLLGRPDPTRGPDAVTDAPPGSPGLTLPGSVVGTPGFMAPEQAAGLTEGADVRTDVYGLGATLGHLLATEGPVPPRLASIVERATAASPDARYPTAAALAADLGRYLDGAAIEAYRETALDRLGRFVSRHKVALGLVAAYVVVRLVILAWRGI